MVLYYPDEEYEEAYDVEFEYAADADVDWYADESEDADWIGEMLLADQRPAAQRRG